MSPKTISLSEPYLNGREWQYVKECLDSGWVSSAGSFVDRFEKAVAKKVGVRHAVGVASGTAALHIALLLLGVRPEEEVLVSALTFIAPVNTIRYVGAHPIFMDANPKTWQVDVDKMERFLEEECEIREGRCFNKKNGRHVSAVIAIHLLGFACEIDKIVSLAKKFHLKVLEDAAEGMGCYYRGRHVGTFGDIAIVSFNGNKVITAGGGGMILTDDEEKAKYARFLTTQARENPYEAIHTEIGFNYRLTNLHSALGLAQLEQLDDFVSKKRAIAAYYDETLQDLPTVTLMPKVPNCQGTYWLYTILLDEDICLEKRQRIIIELNERGIGSRALWHTIHDLPMYRTYQAYRVEKAVQLYERGVSLPSSTNLKAEQLERVCTGLKEFL